jgi:hypothetical protein
MGFVLGLMHVSPQLSVPPAQAQAPDAQMNELAHGSSQAPQWLMSLSVSTQDPEQSVRPVPQVSVHAPEEQTCPLAHALPQDPQLAGSLSRRTQVPLQSSSSGAQLVVEPPSVPVPPPSVTSPPLSMPPLPPSVVPPPSTSAGVLDSPPHAVIATTKKNPSQP